MNTEDVALPDLISMKKSRMTTNRNDDTVAITFDVRIIFILGYVRLDWVKLG